jgi:hypothetical protein
MTAPVKSTSDLDAIGHKFGTDKASNGHDYLRHYEFYFRDWRESAVTLIEIGALNGASLKMWSEYFPKTTIVSIDIDPKVKAFENSRTKIEIGNSGDARFLKTIREKYAQADIIIDDGSHRWDHQRIAFQTLFPMISPGGYYVIEDLHTNYEANFAGNDEFPFISVLKDRVDYLNLRGAKRDAHIGLYNKHTQAIMRAIDSITFIPRACIVKKKAAVKPSLSR